MYRSSLVALTKVLLPLLRTLTNTSVEQTVEPSDGSVAHVFIVDEPPGLPRARAYTEYVVMPSFSGSGFGSWNPETPSVQLPSRTWKSPIERLILQFPKSGTKIL